MMSPSETTMKWDYRVFEGDHYLVMHLIEGGRGWGGRGWGGRGWGVSREEKEEGGKREGRKESLRGDDGRENGESGGNRGSSILDNRLWLRKPS